MTTRDVSSSCEVLWVSRETDETISFFFKQAVEAQQVTPTTLPAALGELEGRGALWLAGGATINIQTGAAFTGDFDSDVIGCSWSKDISSPAGTFSIQLKLRVEYDELIKAGDLLVIFMDNDHRYGYAHRADGTLMTIGIVDRVGKSTNVTGSGATVETATITGRDLGAILQETQTVFDKAFAVIDQSFFESEYITQISKAQLSALSPPENIWTLLNLIYNFNATQSKLVGGQWTLPTTNSGSTGRPLTLLSLINVTSFVQTPIFGYALPQSPGLVQAGNVWALLDGYANRLVNEFFFDIRDFSKGEFATLTQLSIVANAFVPVGALTQQNAARDKIENSKVFNQSTLEEDFTLDDGVTQAPDNPPSPVMAMVLRQMPYDRDAFRALPTHDVHYTEMFDYDVAYSAHDVVNFFKVGFPDLGPVSQELIFGCKVNLDSIPKYGLRRLEGETRYSFASSDAGDSYDEGTGTEVFGEVYLYYVELLSTWHAGNDKLFAGTVSCRFRPEIRIGSRLRVTRIDDKVISFYVQSVNHVFGTNPGQSRTQLTVVRGYQEGLDNLPNNLVWNENRSGIPPNYVTWGRTDPTTGLNITTPADERAKQNSIDENLIELE